MASVAYGNWHRTGEHRESGVPHLRGVRWRVEPGARLTTAPVEAGGLVLVGDDDGGLHAVDARSGAQRWRFEHHDRVTSVSATDRVVFAESESRVTAHDLATGAVLAAVGPGRPYAVGETLLLITTGRIEAFDAAGRRLWSTGGFRRLVKTEPAIAGGRLFVVEYAEPDWPVSLHCLDWSTGRRLWSAEYPHGPYSKDNDDDGEYFCNDMSCLPRRPIVVGDAVLSTYQHFSMGERAVSGGEGIVAYDAATGTQRWWAVRECGTGGIVVTHGEWIHVVGWSDRMTLNLIRLGGPRWEWSVPVGGTHRQSDAWAAGPPLLAHGLLYVADSEGVVHCLNAQDGSVRWGHQSGERCSPAPDIERHESISWVGDEKPDEETGEPAPLLLIGEGVVYLRTDTALHALH